MPITLSWHVNAYVENKATQEGCFERCLNKFKRKEDNQPQIMSINQYQNASFTNNQQEQTKHILKNGI